MPNKETFDGDKAAVMISELVTSTKNIVRELDETISIATDMKDHQNETLHFCSIAQKLVDLKRQGKEDTEGLEEQLKKSREKMPEQMERQPVHFYR